MERTLLVAVAMTLVFLVADGADCFQDHTDSCEDCQANPACVWCNSSIFSLCLGDSQQGYCAPFVEGNIVVDTEPCPVLPLSCQDFDQNCVNCTDGALAAGLNCTFCTVTDGFFGAFKACFPSEKANLCVEASGQPSERGTCVCDPRYEKCGLDIRDGCVVPSTGKVFVSPDGNDDGCCCGGPGNPCASIQCGLAVVNHDPTDGRIEVEVAPGVYMEYDIVAPSAQRFELRSTGGSSETVIEINNRGIGLSLVYPSDAAIIEGFTLRNGRGNKANVGGGCMHVFAGSPTLRDLVFERCTTLRTLTIQSGDEGERPGVYGGALHLRSSLSLVEDCVFRDNFSEDDSSDGGVYGAAVSVLYGTHVFRRCTFENNRAKGDWVKGVAVYIEFQRTEGNVFEECTFRGNVGEATYIPVGGTGTRSKIFGAAIFADKFAGVTSVGCLFEDNKIVSTNLAFGGAVCLTFSGLTVIDSVFRNNTAQSYNSQGGALFSNSAFAGGKVGGIPSIVNCTFEDNNALGRNSEDAQVGVARGGAVSFLTDANSRVELASSSFTGNRADALEAYGGALCVDGVGVTLSGLVFQHNKARAQFDAFGGAVDITSIRVSSLLLDNRIVDSSFEGNVVILSTTRTQTIAGGGGVAVGKATVAVEGCRFTGNSVLPLNEHDNSVGAFVGGGGLLFSREASFASTVRDCVFVGNNATGHLETIGGGLAIGDPHSVEVSACHFEGNYVQGGVAPADARVRFTQGGGIGSYVADIKVRSTVLRGNTAYGIFSGGGGVGFVNPSYSPVPCLLEDLLIEENLVAGNAPTFVGCQGGGVSINTGEAVLLRLTIVRNKVMSTVPEAECSGGGLSMSLIQPPIVASISNSIIVGNTAQESALFYGGAYGLSLIFSDIAIHHTLICGNIGVSASGEVGEESQTSCMLVPCAVTGDSGYQVKQWTQRDMPENACPGTCPAADGSDSGNPAAMCYGNGVCNATRCICDKGHFGELCDGVCNHPEGEPENYCNGHGECDNSPFGDGSCVCSQDYYGHGCAFKCSCGNGTCAFGEDGDGSCTCDDTYYGPACQHQCPGVITTASGEKLACNGNGYCAQGAEGNGTCVCFPEFAGLDCSYCSNPLSYGRGCNKLCPGFDGNCSGHGICNTGQSSNGECECFDGYHRFDCALSPECNPECPGRILGEGCSTVDQCGPGLLCVDSVCESCPDGTISTVGAFTCDTCGQGLYTEDHVECFACREGAECINGIESALPGRWRDSELDFYAKCRRSDATACPGGSLTDGATPCGKGHTGDFCATCQADPHYASSGFRCSPCPSPFLSVLLIILYAAAIGAVAVYNVAFSSPDSVGLPKLVMNHVQTLSIFSTFSAMDRSVLRDALSWLSFASGPSPKLQPLQCLVDLDHFDMVTFAIVLYAIIMAAILLASYVSARRLEGKFGDIAVPILAVWVYISYPAMSTLLLEVFQCRMDIGRLAADLTIVCPSGRYIGFVVLGTVGVLVWVLGIPCSFFIVLHRSSSDTSSLAKRLSFIRQGYRADVSYYESWMLIRKILLVLVAVASENGNIQLAASILVLVFSLGVHLTLLPFRSKIVNRLEVLGILLQMSTCGLASMYLGDGVTDASSIVIVIVVIIANVLYLAVVLLFLLKNSGPVVLRRIIPAMFEIVDQRNQNATLKSAGGELFDLSVPGNHSERADMI